MKKNVYLALSFFTACFLSPYGSTQQSAAVGGPASSTAVPKLVNFSGILSDTNNRPLTAVSGVTFLLYKDSTGGAPLWMETQNVHPDKAGHYTVTIGASSSRGVPADVFLSGEARWLGVQVSGQPEQARVLLVAVPYALKAADAETVGGMPPSAFVLAAPVSVGPLAKVATQSNSGVSPALAGTGTLNFIPLWTPDGNTLGNSAIFQTGTSPTAKVGINMSSPVNALEVQGTAMVHGQFTMPSAGNASASAGKKAYPFDMRASAFNSSTHAAVAQNFQWDAEPAGNNTSTPSATLNLLFGSGSTTPAETGLKIASNGIITFAAGQTFGGGGGGTITGVTAGTDLKGGGTTGNVTLSLDTAKVPQLATSNTFSQAQIVNSSNTTGSIQATSPGTAILGTSSTTSLLVPAISGVSTDSNVNDLTIGVAGTTNSGRGYGVEGIANSSGIGVYGISTTGFGMIGIGASSQAGVRDVGVLGFANGSVGTGVHGYAWAPSSLGATLNNFNTSVGVWADTSGQTQTSNAGAALLATADNAWGGVIGNNSTSYPTLLVKNYETSSSTATLLFTYNDTFGGLCTINAHGDLFCSGSKSAVVPVESGAKKVALYAVEAPENWFEDAGSGELVNGSAVIRLERTFAQTVNTTLDYHVFLTPNGDCKGLYVTRKSATSFEVHELGGGQSSIVFDYRIMAKRKGYEDVRLADKTKEFVAPVREANLAQK